MNPRTTLAGLITALVTMVAWAINTFVTPIPADVTTFVITGAIAIITLFADPNSFKEAPPNVMAVITTVITIATYVLNAFWQIIIPPFIVAAAQAIGIFLFGYYLTDHSK